MKKFILTFISMVCLVGCQSTGKVSGVIEEKNTKTVGKMCYKGNDQCVPEQKFYSFTINGKDVPVYKDTFNKYKQGQQYP
jgi:hypothetical protein